MRIAKERKSSVLASNAVHHRIDCLTSVVALVAIGGSHVLPHASWLDPSGGLLVSLMVIRAGWTNTRAALLELADVGMDDEVKDSVRKATMKAILPSKLCGPSNTMEGNEIGLRNVQGIKAGQNYLVDIELAVPKSLTVGETRDIEDAVRGRVGSTVRGIRRVKVRFVAKDTQMPDFSDEFLGPEISPQSSPEPETEKEMRTERNDHNCAERCGSRKRR